MMQSRMRQAGRSLLSCLVGLALAVGGFGAKAAGQDDKNPGTRPAAKEWSPSITTQAGAAKILSNKQNKKLESLQKASTQPVNLVINKQAASVLLLQMNVPMPAGSKSQKWVMDFLNEYLGLIDPRISPGELKPSSEDNPCASGSTTFQRAVDGIPVAGGTITVRQSSSGAIIQIENSLASVTSTIAKFKLPAKKVVHPLSRDLRTNKTINVDKLPQVKVLVPIEDKNGGHLKHAVVYFASDEKDQTSAVLYDPATNELISDRWNLGPGNNGADNKPELPKFQLDSITGIPTYISYRPIGGLKIPAVSLAVNPIQTVYDYFEHWPAVFRTGSPRCQFSVKDVVQYPSVRDTSFVRMQQIYVGLPVFGAELVFEIKDMNTVMSVMGHTLSNIYLDPIPTLTPGEAIDKARQEFSHEYNAIGAKTGDWESFVPKTELCVFPGELTGRGKLTTHLTYKVEGRDFYVFIDAHDGQPVYTIPRRAADAPGLNFIVNTAGGANEFARPTYREISRNGIPTGATGTADTTLAASFAPIVGGVYSTYGKAGLDGNGLDYVANTNVAIGSGCPNAYFQDQLNEIFVCTGVAVNDVVGHEFTHGIISHSSGLVYQDESGALNESYADIMGNLIFPDVATLAPGVPSWLVGEAATGGPFRDMANPVVPTLNLFRARNIGANTCGLLASSCDSGFVHTNSGITNLAHVLLADGTSIPAAAIAIAPVRPGIGRIKVRHLAFLTMTTRLTPWSRLVDSELGTHETADLLQSLGAAPVLLTGEISPGVFNQLDADLVPVVFGKVGLTPDLVSGYASQQLGFAGTQAFFPGPGPSATTLNGCNVSNVRIKVTTPSGERISQLVPPSTVNYFGVFGATAVAPGPIGTTTKTNTATWFSIFGRSPEMFSEPIANPPAGDDDCRPGLALTVQRTLPVQDKLIPGAGLWSDVVGPAASAMNAACALIRTEVELVDENDNIIAGPGTTAHYERRECAWGQCVVTGFRDASVATAPVGPPNLSTRINWSAFGFLRLRYRVRYSISQPPGINCQP